MSLKSGNKNMWIDEMGDIPEGDFKLDNDQPFMIKNNTEDNIQATVLLCGNSETITTTFYPGWNPEIVRAVEGAVAGKLQWGV